MKLQEIGQALGKKLGFGIISLAAGLTAIGWFAHDKGSNVVALVLGVYGILAGTHVATDLKALTVSKTVTKTEDAC